MDVLDGGQGTTFTIIAAFGGSLLTAVGNYLLNRTDKKSANSIAEARATAELAEKQRDKLFAEAETIRRILHEEIKNLSDKIERLEKVADTYERENAELRASVKILRSDLNAARAFIKEKMGASSLSTIPATEDNTKGNDEPKQ